MSSRMKSNDDLPCLLGECSRQRPMLSFLRRGRRFRGVSDRLALGCSSRRQDHPAFIDNPTRNPAPQPPQVSHVFAPGDIIAGRYRVVNLLGKGGMGEVYRADDLTLNQPVAMKFLPRKLASDPAALSRFHSEVRVARNVAHPNVCRVFDIGESEGRIFLTMEYIDGEDLALLLRRIGRLPSDKATELARQICAGVAAAHDAGILHRDLK